MATLKLHFSPSTQKLEFNETTLQSGGKTWPWVAPCLECPACDFGRTGEDPCGGGIDLPDSLCLDVTGIYRCSDDTLIPQQFICIPYLKQWAVYKGTIDIDSKTYTICFGIGHGTIYNADDVLFVGDAGHEGCFESGNTRARVCGELVIADCGNNKTFSEEYSGGPEITRNVIGYGTAYCGSRIWACDPNTGDHWFYGTL